MPLTQLVNIERPREIVLYDELYKAKCKMQQRFKPKRKVDKSA